MWPAEILSRPYYRYRPRQLFLRFLRGLRSAPPHQEVELPWGVRFRIDTREMLGTSVWQTGVFDIAVSEAIWRLLRPDDLAVDVGANIGYMTGIMASRVGADGRVLAFEPHPAVARALRQNLELLRQRPGVAEVVFHPFALSSRSGEGALVDDVEGFAENHGLARLAGEDEPGAIRVETRRLDDVLEHGTVRVLKMDVEGHEGEVLRGAERLLSSGAIRNLVYEDHLGPHSPVHRQLAAHGYTLHSLGWKSRGLVLGGIGETVAQPFEAPSYLATLEPEPVRRRLSARGWEILRG